jgi:hypothetical protein
MSGAFRRQTSFAVFSTVFVFLLLCSCRSDVRYSGRNEFPFSLLGLDSATLIAQVKGSLGSFPDSITHVGPYSMLHYSANLVGLGRRGDLAFVIAAGRDSLIEWRIRDPTDLEEHQVLDSLDFLLGPSDQTSAQLLSRNTWASDGRIYKEINVRRFSIYVKNYFEGSNIVDQVLYYRAL